MERGDRGEFFAFFLGGAIAIAVLRIWLGSGGFAIVVACGLVGVYAVRLWDREEGRPRFDGAGDQTYYLGFLYTLWSLAILLWQVDADLGGDPEVVQAVLSGFGLAIFSTIAGMVARVVIGRGNESDPASGNAGHASMAEAGRRLRAELDYTVSDFRDFRTRMKQDLEEAVREAIAGVDLTKERARTAETSLTAFESTLAGVAESLSERATELSRSAASLTAIENAASRLHGSLTSAAKEVAKEKKEMAGGARDVREALAAQAANIASLDLQKIFAETIVTPNVEALRAMAESLEDSVGRLREGWETQRGAVERTENSVGRLVESMDRVSSGAQILADAGTAMNDAAAKIRSLNGHAASLGAEGKEALRQLAEFRRGVSGSVEALRGLSEQLVATRSEFVAILSEPQAARPRRSWWRRFWS